MAQVHLKFPFHYTQKSQEAELWVGLILLFGIIEGAFRKWFLPHNLFLPRYSAEIGYLAYLSKDIAFVLLCLLTPSSYMTPLIKRYRTIVKLSIFLTLMGAVLSIFEGVNWVGAFLNVRSILLLPVLSYIAAQHLINVDIRRIAYWVALLSFLPTVISVIQITLPKTHILNSYADPGFEVITFMGQVRATGTFSFISGMASMSFLAVWAGLLLRATAKTPKDIIIGWCAVCAGLVCACTAASRAGLFLSIGFIACIFIIDRLQRKNFAFIAISTLMVLALFNQQQLKNSVDNPLNIASVVFERHNISEGFLGRGLMWEENLVEATRKGVLGEGFGIGQIGGVYVVTGQSQLLRPEFETARIISETGLIGLVGNLILRIWIAYKLLFVWFHLPDSQNRSGLLVCIFAVIIFLTRNIIFDHVASGFTWPLVALSMAWASKQLIESNSYSLNVDKFYEKK